MFKLLKTIVGGVSYAADPKTTGALYLQDKLRKAGANPDGMPREFYQELATYAYDFAQTMAQLRSRDKLVTCFFDHLDYLIGTVQDAFDGQTAQVLEPVRDIFTRYGLKATSL
ncbi:MAG: hypothetical protein K2X67_08380 [Burkholderiales bacterium]|jgi:hypothetical protein|nr:hypothetical protein [Burkholderiales bacterium]